MVQTMSDITQHIIDSLEPEDFIDRLGISAEDLADRAGININKLCRLYKEEIADNLNLFSDVYAESEYD